MIEGRPTSAEDRTAFDAPVKVGVDVTSIAEVADAVATFGDRYLRRLFTAQEIDSCGAPSRAESLAARFAAKEAVLKVLEPTGARPPWRDIEVVRGGSGACRIRLHRRAASLAADRGVGAMSVSLSHEAGVAVAVVAAACSAPGTASRHAAEPIDTEPTDPRGAPR
jgi:holo-[acyl-carrier protein] synthase